LKSSISHLGTYQKLFVLPALLCAAAYAYPKLKDPLIETNNQKFLHNKMMLSKTISERKNSKQITSFHLRNGTYKDY